MFLAECVFDTFMSELDLIDNPFGFVPPILREFNLISWDVLDRAIGFIWPTSKSMH